MIGLLSWSVLAFGLAFIVGHSKISVPFRWWLADRRGAVSDWFLMLVECPPCVGFWAGIVGGVLWRAPFLPSFGGRTLSPLLLALFTCGSNLLLAKLVGLLDPPGAIPTAGGNNDNNRVTSVGDTNDGRTTG